MYNTNEHSEFADRNHGDVITAFRIANKSLILIKIVLEVIFTFIILSIILKDQTSIAFSYYHFLIFFMSFNVAEYLSRLIIYPFSRRKAMVILGK